VVSFDEMEDGDLRRHPAGFDQRGVLQGADRTETGRTDVSAPIAFNALAELLHPILKALLLGEALHFLDIGMVLYRLAKFSVNDFCGVRLPAPATIRKLLATGDPQCFHFLTAKLMVFEELDERPLLAAPNHNPDRFFRILPGDPDQDLGERISTGLIRNPVFEILRSREEIRKRMAMAKLQAKDP
jgi:hypothetical protein